MKNTNIILAVCAGAAIYKSCDLLRRLKDKGYCVTVVMSREARELISPLLFQSLSGNKVYCEMFATTDDYEIEHVSLAQKADLVLIVPATANVIAKIACGICDDLVSCTVCATRAPVLIAPAMNENMYRNRITQENIGKLKSLGYKFVGPIKGRLVNGRLGLGHLADVAEIVKEAGRVLGSSAR